jgi:hypothetical protein
LPLLRYQQTGVDGRIRTYSDINLPRASPEQSRPSRVFAAYA